MKKILLLSLILMLTACQAINELFYNPEPDPNRHTAHTSADNYGHTGNVTVYQNHPDQTPEPYQGNNTHDSQYLSSNQNGVAAQTIPSKNKHKPSGTAVPLEAPSVPSMTPAPAQQ